MLHCAIHHGYFLLLKKKKKIHQEVTSSSKFLSFAVPPPPKLTHTQTAMTHKSSLLVQVSNNVIIILPSRLESNQRLGEKTFIHIAVTTPNIQFTHCIQIIHSVNFDTELLMTSGPMGNMTLPKLLEALKYETYCLFNSIHTL